MPDYTPIPCMDVADPYRWPQYIEVCRLCEVVIGQSPHPDRLRFTDEVNVDCLCRLCAKENGK